MMWAVWEAATDRKQTPSGREKVYSSVERAPNGVGWEIHFIFWNFTLLGLTR